MASTGDLTLTNFIPPPEQYEHLHEESLVHSTSPSKGKGLVILRDFTEVLRLLELAEFPPLGDSSDNGGGGGGGSLWETSARALRGTGSSDYIAMEATTKSEISMKY